jgi:hypothetical protein
MQDLAGILSIIFLAICAYIGSYDKNKRDRH